MIKKGSILTIILIFNLLNGQSQAPKDNPSGEILQSLEKLNTLGSVLYIAAHPDDENTQLISYFANGIHLRAGYLSATRGGGGQNLIGTEIKESLGVIRTQELLAARRMDGGDQFFSRAVDFGYSKDPVETFNKWDENQVLADFVWVIRKFKPDVIVTRFNIDPGTTHGHHTASAILAKKAFELSNDPLAFPEQLEYVDLWEVKKIFWNTSTWFYQRTKQPFNPEDFVKVDVGQYSSYLGKSYTEIAAESRSMHKSQGFGRVGSRGSEYEYLEQWGGEITPDLFGGIDMSWGRISGTEEIKFHLEEALLNFDSKSPELILPDLLGARKLIENLEDDFWKDIKLKEIDEVIKAATGVYLEFVADQSEYAPGDTITISFEAINRSNIDVILSGVSFSRWSENYIYDLKLSDNQINTLNYSLDFSERVPLSDPYWLVKTGSEGMYRVDEQELIGLPENLPVIIAEVTLKLADQFMEYQIPVIFKRSDRVRGEIYAPISITPPVMVNMDKKALIYAKNGSKDIEVTLIAGKKNQSGQVALQIPEGWRSEPKSQDFALNQKGDEQVYKFKLYPSALASVGVIKASVIIEGETFDKGREEIVFDHIPTQIRFPKAETKVVRLDLVKAGEKIGYIMGAGDEVPYSLEQIGYKVELLTKEDIVAENLLRYDAVILGIRAFNTLDWLTFKNKELFKYTELGGTVIVQYNTNGTMTDELAPYSLKISRDRVSVEDAEVRFLVKKHEVLYRPNKLSNLDFENWVQERGLYFPDQWDANFEAVISINDPGETPKDGSLLVAKYGKGYYIYTGLSFFRELPAGVPGAFRLMANLISIGKENKPK